MIKLFRRNSLGVGTWRCWGVVDSTTRGRVFVAHSVVEGGSEVQHEVPLSINASGRSIEAQLELEIASRVSRQLDKGYKHAREEALLGSTNQLGLVNPMLAQKITDVRLGASHFEGAFVQPKFDGHRCLITKQGGEMLAYSRKGKPITTIPHILEDCQQWMQDGDTVDGELYVHGLQLQTISSLIKREQPDSRKLNYHWYDMVLDSPFEERYRLMADLFGNVRTPQIELVPTTRVHKMSTVYELFRQYRDGGWEGAMLRLSIRGYEGAKRSDQLLKVKERHDMEVTVLDGRPSSQGWAILRVRTDQGIEFDISAPGSVAQKTEVLHNLSSYVGRRLTIEYAGLTAENVPFHAVAMRWYEEV